MDEKRVKGRLSTVSTYENVEKHPHIVEKYEENRRNSVDKKYFFVEKHVESVTKPLYRRHISRFHSPKVPYFYPYIVLTYSYEHNIMLQHDDTDPMIWGLLQ